MPADVFKFQSSKYEVSENLWGYSFPIVNLLCSVFKYVWDVKGLVGQSFLNRLTIKDIVPKRCIAEIKDSHDMIYKRQIYSF